MEPEELMAKLRTYYNTSIDIAEWKNNSEYQKLFDEVDEDEEDLLEQLDDNPFAQREFLDVSGSTKAEHKKSPLFTPQEAGPSELKLTLNTLEKLKGGYEPYIIDIEALVLRPLATMTKTEIGGWNNLVWLKEPTYKMLAKRFDEAIKARAEMQECKEKVDRYVERIQRILEDGHDFVY